MQFEVSYGKHLINIESNIENYTPIADDGDKTLSSIDSTFRNLVNQFIIDGNFHLNLASNLETLVLKPFSNWSNDHYQRIKFSEKILKKNINNFKKSKIYIKQLENDYLNNCREFEEFKKNNHINEKILNEYHILINKIKNENDHKFFANVAGIDFDYMTMKDTIRILLVDLPKNDYKVPILKFNISNTNNGNEIVNFLLKNLSLRDINQAEKFGQDLINLGFLKYCNGMGNTFANSTKFQFQWKSYAYEFVKIPEIKETISSIKITDSTSVKQDGKEQKQEQEEENDDKFNEKIYELKIKPKSFTILPIDNEIIELIKNNYNSNDKKIINDNDLNFFKIINNLQKTDLKYFQECFKMDNLRCSLEELMIDHLSFMEKCELDRLNAIKKATLDFLSIINNNFDNLKISINQLIIDSKNLINTNNDLLNLIINNNTGYFQPNVITYNNYYNPGNYQNFGIDIETRCRLDKKIVPLLISTILYYMDQLYPEMINDHFRTSIWIKPVKLKESHKLRSLLNYKTYTDNNEILNILKESNTQPSVIASVLKIYLLELPEPLISNNISDVLKILYSDYPIKKIKIEQKKEEEGNDEEQEDKNEKTLNNDETDKENTSSRREGTFGSEISTGTETEIDTEKEITPLPKLNETDDDTTMINNNNDDSIDNTDPVQLEIDSKRIKGLIAILSTISKPHIATLDAISTHFYRLIKILKMGGNDGNILAKNFMDSISQEFANCIIKIVKTDDIDLGRNIFYDLLSYKKRIFRELKKFVVNDK